MKEIGGYLIGFVIAGAVLLGGCGDNAVGPKTSAALSNVSPMDSVYAGYPLIDNNERPDTLKVSFEYNASKVTSISVSATLDSGKTWIPISVIAPNASNRATVVWPLCSDADTAHFNYFGFKEAYIKIADTASGASITTEKFAVVGSVPFVLAAPLGGETFSINDSIAIRYDVNIDLTAQVTPCVRPHDTSILWVALTTSNSADSIPSIRYPLKSHIRKFTLATFSSWSTQWADHPLQIMLKDYGPGKKTTYSGLIAIVGH